MRDEKGILFILPALAVFGLFILLPAAHTFYYSVTTWNGIGVPDFVGLKNFRRAFFSDEIYVTSYLHVGYYIIGTLVAEVFVGLVLAILLSGRHVGFGVFRTIFFAPYMISMTVVGLLWAFVYDGNFGLVNSFLELIGLADLTRAWLGDRATAMPAVIIASGWKYAGFFMVIFYTGIQQIPSDLYEAAVIDGASEWKKTWYVTIPLLGPVSRPAILLCIAGGFGAFALFFAMTNGNPFHATEIPSTWIVKQAFDRKNMGYGAALTLILTIVSASVSLLYMRFTRHRDEV